MATSRLITPFITPLPELLPSSAPPGTATTPQADDPLLTKVLLLFHFSGYGASLASPIPSNSPA